MTESQPKYGVLEHGAQHHPNNIPNSSAKHHGHYDPAGPRTIVRAATEESAEELVRHDYHMKSNQMLPPFQKPIPTKPDRYGMYNPYTNSPPSSRYQFQQSSPPHHYHPSSGPHHSAHSVITSSFSIEDGSFGHERGYYQGERRSDGMARKFTRRNSDPVEQQREQPPPSLVVATSPNDRHDQSSNLRRAFSSLSRSFSSGSDYINTTPPMKRSFFHHAKSNELSPAHLPADFVPPKRSKLDQSPPRNEVTIQPRLSAPGSWYHKKQAWEAREEGHAMETNSPISNFNSPVQYNRGQWYTPHESAHSNSSQGSTIHRPSARLHPPMVAGHQQHHQYQQYGPPPDHESPRPYWSQGHQDNWHSPYNPSHQFWGSPSYSWQQHRDDLESSRHGPHEYRTDYRQGDGYRHDGPEYRDSYDGGREENMVSDRDQIFRSPHAMANSQSSVVEVKAYNDSSPGKPDEPLFLLALPQDRRALSETLCVVRENIEVFTATQTDVDAPAPGRKHAVSVGQVGLRCIHCRHTTRASDRVKRAVCYPSSIKRIYRTVIDMKLDHFSQCKFVPKALTDRLNELKAVHTRSTGTTMQYFIKAAHMLGMEDASSGVRLNLAKKEDLTSQSATDAISNMSKKKPQPAAVRSDSFMAESSSSFAIAMDVSSPLRKDSMASASFESTTLSEPLDESGNYFDGNIPLALPEDKTALSPLRCFLREQVCAFSATEEDIAVRAPTTFSITLGQVGIGCIHCVNQPPKYRSNRAVCFPFSIGRIYQSVADIQRFHLGECKMLPPDVKEKFLSLQSASSKGSKGLATRQYWVASARKLGLVDTQKGIRFGRDPSQPHQNKAFSLDILAQAAFSVTTTNKKLVLPEDKNTIAEFLYVVMEQLQPCRFTEADRNKRRVRDVGCIGVECKHCAGQVDSRKFFWSSVSAVESNFVSVHTHMLECKMVPGDLKEKLTELKKLRKEQTAQLMTGSQKSFFRRVWERLHREEIGAPGSPGSPSSSKEAMSISGNSVPDVNMEIVSDTETNTVDHQAKQETIIRQQNDIEIKKEIEADTERDSNNKRESPKADESDRQVAEATNSNSVQAQEQAQAIEEV